MWVLADDFVRVRPVAVGHLVDCGGEQIVADEDVGVFGEEAEDQPRHEMVHVVAFVGATPVGIVLDQLDIEPVKAAGRADVKRAFADLLDGGDTGQRQEEAEMVGEIGVAAGDGFASGDVLGLKVDAIGRKDELGFGAGSDGAGAKGVKRDRNFAYDTCLDMYVVCLKNTANVRFVRRACAQTLDGGVLVAKGHEESIGKFSRIERLLCKFRNSLFNFNSVH